MLRHARLALLVVSFVWLFLVGCTTAVAPTPTNLPPTPIPPLPTTETETEPIATNSDDDAYGDIDSLNLSGVNIVFWHQHRDVREEALKAIIDEFNATNPYGITVEAHYEEDYATIYDKMIAGMSSGDLPDIVVAYQNQAADYQASDRLVSLDPYINHPVYGLTEAELQDFFPAFLAQDRLPQFGDQTFAFPPNRSIEVLYYNQDWLERLGYSGPPTTPEEFYEMACAASDPSAGTIGYQISTDASRFASFVFARGGDIYDYENNRYTLNTPEAVEAMTLMQKMVNDGCARLMAERNADQNDFTNELTLFTIGSSARLAIYEEAIAAATDNAPFNWSVAAVPFTTAVPVQNIYGASVSLPRTTPERQLAAWLFLKHYTSPQVQARWAIASNYFPVRQSVANELESYFAENPTYATAFDLLQYGKSEPPVGGYDGVRDLISEAFTRIINGEDVRTVLDELNERANQSLP